MPRPLALYIHWPFCKSKCPYCDFNSHVRESVDQARWREALLAELEYMAARTPGRKLASIFFGGGTPSLMLAATAGALIEKAQQLWPAAGDIEITLEANPTSVEADTFADFKIAGINRVSLGVQSLIDSELMFLGREHSAKEALAAVSRAREVFERFSFDLIYARPNQTPQAWEKELGEALAYAGKHLSLYQLTIEENTAFHHAYKKHQFALPDEETAEALYRLTEDMLAARGMAAYEVSNYAGPGEESRHNLSYWRGDEYVGVGPGAHGRLELENGRTGEVGNKSILSPIPQFSRSPIRVATATLKSPERWLESVEKNGHAVEVWQEIGAREEAEERVMMGLRMTRGIEYERFRPHINAKKRALYIREGLLADDDKMLRATFKGRLLLNRLAAELLS